MTNIPCKQCGFENEIQRIYCHNCGAKLDRSALPQESKPTISLVKQQRRLKRLTNPGGGFFTGWTRTLPETILLAVMAAALIQAVRPPNGAPTPRKKNEFVDSPPIVRLLGDVIAAHLKQRVSITESDANAYLFNTIKAQEQDLPLLGKVARFDRAYVTMEDGSCAVIMCQMLHDYSLHHEYPFYFGSRYKLEIKDGKLQATNLGGCVGRLPIHPLLMQTGALAFGNLWEDLKREKALFDKLQMLEVHKGQMIVETKGDPTLAR